MQENETNDARIAQARAEGYEALREDYGLHMNPWMVGTPEHDAWIKGWQQSLRDMDLCLKADDDAGHSNFGNDVLLGLPVEEWRALCGDMDSL